MKPQLPRRKKSPGTLPGCACGAFSLLEMIGVLAVIAVLASAMLPAAIKRIDLRTREQEVVKLGAISNALTQSALRGKSVPDYSTWSGAAASYGSLSVSQLTANSRRFNRIYYGQGVPYAQTPAGTNSFPGSCRAVVVSVLGGDALNPGVNCPNPSSIAAADFQYLWGLADGTEPNSGLWASRKGMGDDVLIQRVNYTPLFHQLILVNRDTVPTYFTIDGSSFQPLPPIPRREAYYLDGTVVGLCMPDGTTTTNKYILKRDISFVFEQGVWRCKIGAVPTNDTTATGFGQQAKSFMAATLNGNNFKGANQQGIVTAMYTFMLTYTFWADRYPHFGTLATIQQVPEYIILQQLGDPTKDLDTFSSNLIK
jgi:type II secretory pathway pseudopilin PulG